MEFLDLLFSRYASPFILLDNLIESNRLSEFIDTIYKQNEEEKLWELYIHKVFDKSFIEFKDSLTNSSTNSEKMTETEIEATINDSMDILNSCNPIE